MSARRALAAALAVVALAGTACSDGGPGEGEARLEVDGEAVVVRADGGEDVVDDATNVGPGDRIEVSDGVATLALTGGTLLELRAGIEGAADTEVVMGEVPVLMAGDLLVAAPRSTSVEADDTLVEVEGGVAQVSRSLGMAVAAYDATVQLDSAGQQRSVPALREMRVPSLGRPPQAPRPLDYDERDPWDRRLLGVAIELGDRLENLARGYTSSLREGEGRTPGFFRLVLPGLDDEPELTAELISLERDPGETLVGAAIADLGRRGGFAERWRSVFQFRDEGAHWGLVALDQDVSGDPLLGSIEAAVGASPLEFVAPTTTAPPGPATTSSTTGTTAPPTPPTTGTSTTAPPAPPTTEPPEPENPLDPVLEPDAGLLTEVVNGLVDGLLGLFDPPPGG